MPHDVSLVATIVIALVLAFVLGVAVNRIRVPPIAGYLLAGVIMGPFTPGYVADQSVASQLAEIGVILLMFGVGLHFSFRELLALRGLAVPGAVGQMAVATLMGMALAQLMGMGLGAGFVFGLSLSVASTVVLLRALHDRRMTDTDRGRIAVGWLIVEDLAMVIALVLIPAIAGALQSGAGAGFGSERLISIGITLLWTIVKVGAFAALMLVVGRRVIPWILHYVAHTGSRELFRLAVLAIALGVAFGAATLFGVSFALGAFFAGMVLSESELSQAAAEESLPLRDAFAVLFFVSVGMLLNPAVFVREPAALAGALLIVLLGKSIAAFAIVKAFGHPTSTALSISASLAQIGEFSFILAALGMDVGLLEHAARDLIVATAIISILLNPFVFECADWLTRRLAKPGAEPEAAPAPPSNGHVVLVGYGRVGSRVGAALRGMGSRFLVIEDNDEAAKAARADGAEVVVGNGASANVLKGARLGEATMLLITTPVVFEAAQIIQQARAVNPGLTIVARAHSDAEVDYLMQIGATRTIMGEEEIAGAMISQLRQAQTPSFAAT